MPDTRAAASCTAALTEFEAASNLEAMTLTQLAAAIKSELDQLDREQIGHYLIEAKKRLPHGRFMTWVSENFPEISHKTATSWMKLAAGAQEETDSPKRDTVNPADRAKKKLDDALKTLAEITPEEAGGLDRAHLETLAKKIMPLVPEPLVGSCGLNMLVGIADRVVKWAEIPAAALSKFELVDKKGKKKKHRPFPALHDVARIILDQGMHPDEVMCLRVEHVDFGKGVLRVIEGKSRAAKRALVMTPNTKAILAARAAGRSEGWMFEGKKLGTHLTKLNNAHDAVVAKIGAEFVMYELRHTLATRFGETVGDPIALAAILGHSSLRVVMKYCHPQVSHTARAMEKYIGSLAVEPREIAKAAVN